MTAAVVFLFDVDNTLLDGDAIVADVHSHAETAFGPARAGRYWAIFDQLRRDAGCVDYLGALQRYRREAESEGRDEAQILSMSEFLLDYPFVDRLYPHALEVLEHFRQYGPTVLLTDGDIVFQPRKLRQSGLWQAVEGRALIYLHKEQMLDAVQRRHPARHYVMVDDKLRILSAMKGIWRERLTTVFPRQGHYALDFATISIFPDADMAVDRVGELIDVDPTGLIALASRPIGR